MFCFHKYTIINRIAIYDNEKSTVPKHYEYVVFCKKCGKIKSKKI